MVKDERHESKHAEVLLARGFTPVDKQYSLMARERAYAKKLSRNERRQLRAMKYRPWFTRSELFTTATDETGQSWTGPTDADLTDLGFEDKTEEAQRLMRQRRQSDRQYN